MSKNKIDQLILIFAALCLFFGTENIQSAQLIDEFPTAINGDWSICVVYTNGQSDCNNGVLKDIKPFYEQSVVQFIYKKQLIISSELNQTILGLWLNVVDEADEVRFNGFLIGKTGKAPPNFQTAFRYPRHYLIPHHVIKYDQFNQLEIKTFSSINRPGIYQHQVLINQYLDRYTNQKRISTLYISIVTILILLTLFQFYYYFMVKGNDETIYLTVFLLAFTFITFTRSTVPLHIGLDLNAIIKIELFLISTGFVAFIFFTFRFLELKVNKLTIVSSIVISLVGIISIIYPNPLHLRFIYEGGYWIILLSSFLILSYAMFSASPKRRKYSRFINSNGLLAWGFIGFDALSQSKALFNWHIEIKPWLLPMVAALVGIAMMIAVTHKYWRVFKTANYDQLTGMLLKPVFFSRLNEKLNQVRTDNTSLLVAVINISEVSHISRSFGQNIGNNLMQLISLSIYKSIAPTDLVCQFNPQEFCIAVNANSQNDAEQFIKQFHQSLVSNQQPLSDETELYIGAKIGAVVYNFEQHQSLTQLLQDANYGLERAKNQASQDVVLVKNLSRT
ncbi:MAG: diguanylate cyclase [Enterobacterales bacterium]|nr:diguanylate cyclase [Enterobacterales bacterium]